jgi:hypothetical protein
MGETLVPPSVSEDDDDVVIALETARVEEERGSPAEAARWVQRAAGAARKQGRPNRAGELSRVQAMLAEAANQFQRASEPQQTLDTDDDFTEHTIVDRPPVEPTVLSPQATPPSEAPSHIPEARSSQLPSAPPPQVAPAPRPPSQPQKPEPLGPETHLATRVAVRKGTGGMLLVRPLRSDENPAAGEQAALLVPLDPNVRLG